MGHNDAQGLSDAFKNSELIAGAPILEKNSNSDSAVRQSRTFWDAMVRTACTILFGGVVVFLWSYCAHRFYIAPKIWWPNTSGIGLPSIGFGALYVGLLAVITGAAVAARHKAFGHAVRRDSEDIKSEVVITVALSIPFAILIAILAYRTGDKVFDTPLCSSIGSTPVYVFLHRESGSADVYTSYNIPGQLPNAVFSLSPISDGNSTITAASETFRLSRTVSNYPESQPMNVFYDLGAGTAMVPSLNLTATFPAGASATTHFPVSFPPDMDTTLVARGYEGTLEYTTVRSVSALGSAPAVLRVHGHAPGDCSLLEVCIANSQGLEAAKVLVPLGLVMRRHIIDPNAC